MGPTLKRYINQVKYLVKIARTKQSKYFMSQTYAHVLEKGMGMKNSRHGFGLDKCETLIGELETLYAMGDTHCYEYQEPVAALEAYLAYQKADGVDVSALETRAAPLIAAKDGSAVGGVHIMTKDELLAGTRIDFDTYVQTRRSMRYFSDEPVTDEEILRAVSLAKMCPNACNREPWRVYYSLNTDTCAKMAEALPHQGFFADVPYFCVITVDRTAFNKDEIFQWFVNGGIFLGFFVLSLHHLGIGSCALEYNVFAESAGWLREMLGITEREEIVAMVGYGKYPPEAKILCADRRSTEEIVSAV